MTPEELVGKKYVFEDGMVLEIGREQVESRLARFLAAYPRALAPLNRKIEYVDLRYANGFALRIPELAKAEGREPRSYHGVFASHPDADTRLHLLLGGFNGAYQIPTRPGQSTLGYNVLGTSTFDSAHLNERQTEATAFAVLSLQKRFDNKDIQISLFNRTSTLRYRPDAIGDILFNGIAQWAARENVATGIQADGSWQIDDRHTLRAGFVVQTERAGVAVGAVDGLQSHLRRLRPDDASGDAGRLPGPYPRAHHGSGRGEGSRRRQCGEDRDAVRCH